MIKYLLKVVERAYDKEIYAGGIALFRIFYCLVLLCEVIQLFYFRNLIYDKIPFIIPADVDFTLPLIFWMISILFLVFGLYTRQAAIVNYLFSLTFIGTIDTYEYHMFYVYMGVNFLLIFLNSSQVYSLDRLRLKLKYSNTRFNYVPSDKVSVLNYYIVVLVAIGFVYADSVFFKLTSHNWMHGIGLWLPASLPSVVHANLSWLLNVKAITLFLGYLTLVFETVFIFLFWNKKFRVVLLLVGVGLHLGIAVVFPIPWFGLGVSALYLLLVPVSWWKKIGRRFECKTPRLVFYYDEECPLCNRTRIVIKHFDVFNAIDFKGVQGYGFNHPDLAAFSKDELLDNIFSITHKGKVRQGVDTYAYAFRRIPAFFFIGILMGIPGLHQLAKWIYRLIARNREVERCNENNCGYVPPVVPVNSDDIKLMSRFKLKDLRVAFITLAFAILIFLQLNVTYNAALIKQFRESIGLYNSGVEKSINKLRVPLLYSSKVFLGIGSHPVFMDRHFEGYNHVIAVEAEVDGKRYWLPIVDKKGMAGFYIYSFNWVKWTFRVNAPKVDQEVLRIGVRDFGAFWSVKHGFKPKDVKFNIYVKKVIVPKEWADDHLNEQMKHPWQQVGVMYWKDDAFVSETPIIEDL